MLRLYVSGKPQLNNNSSLLMIYQPRSTGRSYLSLTVVLKWLRLIPNQEKV